MFLLKLQLQRQYCGRQEGFYTREKYFSLLQTRHAISCAVNFKNAGVVTQGRTGLGSRSRGSR
jgi:hypothetical protein